MLNSKIARVYPNENSVDSIDSAQRMIDFNLVKPINWNEWLHDLSGRILLQMTWK